MADAAPAFAAGERSWDLRTLLYGSFMPLIRHFEIGEGALLAINLVLIWCRRPSPSLGLFQSALSILVLSAVYEFNDLWDARDDLQNPRKDRRLALSYLEHSRRFYQALAVEHAAILLWAFWIGGPRIGAAVFLAFLLNTVYSMRLKSIPVLDILIVGLWGASCVAVTGIPLRISYVVGLLTAISHVYQMLLDKDVDAINGILTTAVQSRGLMRTLLFLLCAALALALRGGLGSAAALSAFVPFAIVLGVKDKWTSYALNKAYCGAVILAAVVRPVIANH